MNSIPMIDMAATGRNIARLRRVSGLSIVWNRLKVQRYVVMQRFLVLFQAEK